MRKAMRNILIAPLVLIFIPVTLGAWFLSWLFARLSVGAEWVYDNTPRWKL